MSNHAEDYFDHVAALHRQGLNQDGTPRHPALIWNVNIERHPDGYYCAVDLDIVDSLGEDGKYPAGYGRTPLAAIVELLDEMGGVI